VKKGGKEYTSGNYVQKRKPEIIDIQNNSKRMPVDGISLTSNDDIVTRGLINPITV
jgi:hypothetical protein